MIIPDHRRRVFLNKLYYRSTKTERKHGIARIIEFKWSGLSLERMK
jgi:hypothetical protein